MSSRLLTFAAAALLAPSCADRVPEAPVKPTAQSLQANVVKTKCLRCHTSGGRADAGVVLDDIAAALVGKVRVGKEHDHKPFLFLPGCAGKSLFYLVVRDKKMPDPSSGIPFLTDTEVKAVETWINGSGKACGPDKDEPGTPDEPLDPPDPP